MPIPADIFIGVVILLTQSGVLAYCIKIEHRLTVLETLIKRNGS